MANTALITGANRGIGLELARQYAREGHEVIRMMRGIDKADPLFGTTVALDVTSGESVAKAAAALGDRTLLFAGDPATGRDIVRRLSDVKAPVVTVIRSRDESADADGWNDGSCYVEVSREELPVRRLVAVKLQRECK